MEKISVKKTERPQNKNLRKLKKGETLPGNGRPKGKLNWKTVQRIGFLEYCKEKGMNDSEAEIWIAKQGFYLMEKGSATAWQEANNRNFGKVKDVLETEQKIIILDDGDLADNYGIEEKN